MSLTRDWLGTLSCSTSLRNFHYSAGSKSCHKTLQLSPTKRFFLGGIKWDYGNCVHRLNFILFIHELKLSELRIWYDIEKAPMMYVCG